MSQHVEESHEDFKWGNSVPVIDGSGLKAYKSFTYKGVEYSLYDSIYTYRDGAKDTDIGKLVKLWESKKGTKRGKVVWFFRPSDICNFLRDYRVSWNELFLASGGGVGVSNVIPLEAIIGKCNVVCTAKDRRNHWLESDLAKANYRISHIFDVGELRISEKFPDMIDKIKVENLFNWNQGKVKASVECRDGLGTGARLKVEEKPTLTAEKPTEAEVQPSKKRKILAVAETGSLSPSQDTRRWFSALVSSGA
ncbi:hypothetical protein SOVF_155510 [Spinacia oleracea]|nr:hypothetical protein SOVF_155510 [Spinacia oleracea]